MDTPNPLNPLDAQKDLTSLTDQNWLFINAFLSCGSIKQAYQIAGYTGKSPNAPYVIFKHLKKHIENIGDLDITSRARLQADVNKALNLPLSADKKEVTISEWLRIRKFAASLTPEATQQKPQISVLVINRPSNSNNTPTDSISKDVIDVQIIPGE